MKVRLIGSRVLTDRGSTRGVGFEGRERLSDWDTAFRDSKGFSKVYESSVHSIVGRGLIEFQGHTRDCGRRW